ncbi:NADH-quinone oxidoreductase subunit NuoG, partial [Dokdonella sp.]|uniref:NADH-quinone oxidoreductase subunit NuoG n=1 Tax=Dokdonella sp. TaxID=2291710 RepID=UPI003C3B3BEA
LDCPICDQGGECELQDLSMGYGRSVSRFVETKRTIPDENLGPLVETEMTRCIQCTRCVRVMAEVAGTYELGGMERGERLQIGTYVGKPLMSELSGNVIDVCPVGALTNKPFRFKARAWELIARESIGYHDALGSNLWLHTRRGEVLRSVPRDNEAINECWLSDRDRYSHEGLYSADRATMPMVRKGGELVETSWTEALAFVAEHLRKSGTDLGSLVAPLTSSEEGHLLAQLLRGLGSDDIDHRLRQVDFSDSPRASAFETPFAEIEKADAILLIGCNPRHEIPLLNHRLRKAVSAGAKVHVVNPLDFDFNFALAGKQIATPAAMVDRVLGLARAANDTGRLPASSGLAAELVKMDADDSARAIVKLLADSSASVLIVGESVVQHADAAWLRTAAKFIARATGSGYNEIPSGANAIGLADSGVAPQKDGRTAGGMMENPPKTLVVYQAGSSDFALPLAFEQACANADFHLHMGAYASENVRKTADAVLPIGLPPEIDASYTNIDGVVQSVYAASKLPGDARPGWKVLRALGSALALDGFGFTEISEVREQMSKASGNATEPGARKTTSAQQQGMFQRIATTAIYRSDAVLRRSSSLNAHPLTRGALVALHPADAAGLGFAQGDQAWVEKTQLSVHLDARVPKGAAWIEAGYADVARLPADGVMLRIARATA